MAKDIEHSLHMHAEHVALETIFGPIPGVDMILPLHAGDREARGAHHACRNAKRHDLRERGSILQ